jgi:hypothetical protein
MKLETQATLRLVLNLIYSLSKCRKISIEMIIIMTAMVLIGVDTEFKVVGGEMITIRKSGGLKVTHLQNLV